MTAISLAREHCSWRLKSKTAVMPFLGFQEKLLAQVNAMLGGTIWITMNYLSWFCKHKYYHTFVPLGHFGDGTPVSSSSDSKVIFAISQLILDHNSLRPFQSLKTKCSTQYKHVQETTVKCEKDRSICHNRTYTINHVILSMWIIKMAYFYEAEIR